MTTDAETWWPADLKKPPRLFAGNKIAVVSCSWGGPAVFPHRYQAGKRFLTERFGLNVVETEHALRDPAWLDAHPDARADDLMAAFADPSIKAVVASIGGDDAIRLIPHIDLSVLRDNPTLFVGYSDPTTLHFGCLKAGIVSLHGPTVMAGFAENGGMSSLSEETFRRAAFEAAPMGILPANEEGWTVEHLPWERPELQDQPRKRTSATPIETLQGTGTVRGRLIGGCAEVLEMLKGTPWWPPLDYWDGAILFYETSEEAPSGGLVLRWLRNFAAQGILQRLSGLLVARPGGETTAESRKDQKTAICRALAEAGLEQLPVLADLDFGHTDPVATLPYGVMAEIDCARAQLTILEAAVG